MKQQTLAMTATKVQDLQTTVSGLALQHPLPYPKSPIFLALESSQSNLAISGSGLLSYYRNRIHPITHPNNSTEPRCQVLLPNKDFRSAKG